MAPEQLIDCDPDRLPTPVAQIVARTFRAPRADDADAFLDLLYVAEVVIKWHATILLSAVHDVERDEANHIGAIVARANSLGDWSRAIDMALAVSRRNARVQSLSSHRHWLETTQQEGLSGQLPRALSATNEILAILGEASLRYSKNVAGIMRVLVALRNATRAHGALTAGMYRGINPLLATMLGCIVANDYTAEGTFLFSLEPTGDSLTECLSLRGTAPRKRVTHELPPLAGVSLWFQYRGASETHAITPVLQVDYDTLAFYFANGELRADGLAPFLDYATGRNATLSLDAFLGIPPERPPSSTAGPSRLQYTERAGHNLPDAPIDYVSRPILEERLTNYLTDRRNRLVTLQGPGGAGKTSLALATLYQLLESEEPTPFDFIVWCSARDVDLLESAPRKTRREVSDLTSIAELFCVMVERRERGLEAVGVLAEALEGHDPRYLLVLDNFETVDDATGVFTFLNDHVTLSNRAVITARQHDFSGDQVLPVVRMEAAEARQLLVHEAEMRGIASTLDDRMITRIHEACAGNPYSMKLVIAQLTLTKNLEEVLRTTFGRADLQEALCERAYVDLDYWAAYLFLLLGQLRFDPLESMLHIPSARHAFRLNAVRASLLARSLAESGVTAAGERMLMASELHRAFARQKVIGDEREPIVIEDAQFLNQYRPTDREPKTALLFRRLGEEMVMALKAGHGDEAAELLAGLSAIASAEPQFLAEEARFLVLAQVDRERVRSAFKRSVEWKNDDPTVWMSWADYERDAGARTEELRLLASCASRCPDDLALNCELASRIADAFNSVKFTVAADERVPYLRPCRENLEVRAADLDAQGLSRLAWLYLLEGDEARARTIVQMGLDRPGGSKSRYLVNLAERLDM